QQASIRGEAKRCVAVDRRGRNPGSGVRGKPVRARHGGGIAPLFRSRRHVQPGEPVFSDRRISAAQGAPPPPLGERVGSLGAAAADQRAPGKLDPPRSPRSPRLRGWFHFWRRTAGPLSSGGRAECTILILPPDGNSIQTKQHFS